MLKSMQEHIMNTIHTNISRLEEELGFHEETDDQDMESDDDSFNDNEDLNS